VSSSPDSINSSTENSPAESPASSSSDVATSVDSPACGLRQSDRLFVIVLSSIILVLSLVHIVRLSWRGTPAFEIQRLPRHVAEFRIDVNNATWVEWMQLPEIGEVLARQIVEDRKQHGPFASVEELQRVKGIGAVKMEKIRPFLKLQSATVHRPAPTSPAHHKN